MLLALGSALNCTAPPRATRAPSSPGSSPAASAPPPAPSAPRSIGSRWVYPLPQGNSLSDVWVAATGEAYAVGDAGTIVRIAKEGAPNWTVHEVSGNPNFNVVWGNERAIYVGGDAGTLVVSRDGGQTFVGVDSGARADIWGIGGCGRSVYAVGTDGRFARSLDDGSTWSAGHVPDAPPPRTEWGSWSAFDLTDVSCDEKGNLTAIGYGGFIFQSADHGDVWRRFRVSPAALKTRPYPPVADLGFVKLVRTKDELLILSAIGVPGPSAKLPTRRWSHVLTVHGDDVKPWPVVEVLEENVARDLTGAPVGASGLVVTAGGNAALVGAGFEWWRESDGTEWHRASRDNPSGFPSNQGSIDRVAGDEHRLYGVGVWGSVSVSEDMGRHWRNLRSPVDELRAIWSDGTRAVTAGMGVSISRDAGKTWSAPHTISAANHLGVRDLWCATLDCYITSDNGLLHSADGGAAFSPVSPADPGLFCAGAVWGHGPHDVLVATGLCDARWSVQRALILRGSSSKLVTTVDAPPPPLGLYQPVFTALHGNDEGRVYAGGAHGMLLRSTDSGATFAPLAGLDETHEVRAVHAGRGDHLWVLTAPWKGTTTSRLLESSDGGAHFSPLGSPVDGLPITAIGGSPEGELVVAAGGRLFERDSAGERFTELSVGARSGSSPLLRLFAAAPHEILAIAGSGAIIRVSELND